MPDFTVIMATWNRGKHILPSVRSVLAQSHRDFEFLVIGDDVTDDTAAQLATITDPRLRWINNSPRWGTQSGPNNRGIAEAQAPFVVYIGHDDIWAPGHLAAMWDVRQVVPDADVIVSGLLIHRLHASRPYIVSGMLTPGSGQETRCFFPPTATAHRVEIVRETPWPRKEDAIVAIDYDLQRELTERGAVFAATGRITAHKFTSASRYLSYFEPESVEQEQMVTRMGDPDYAAWVEGSVAMAKRTGDFMPEETRPVDPAQTKDRLAQVAAGRGIDGLPANLHVGAGITLLQGDDNRVGEWRQRLNGGQYRLVGQNPNPRLLIPLLSDEPVRVRLRVRARQPAHLQALHLRLNGEPISHTAKLSAGKGEMTQGSLVFEAALRPDRASVLVIAQQNNAIRTGSEESSLAVGAMTVLPLRMLRKRSLSRKLINAVSGLVGSFAARPRA